MLLCKCVGHILLRKTSKRKARWHAPSCDNYREESGVGALRLFLLNVFSFQLKSGQMEKIHGPTQHLLYSEKIPLCFFFPSGNANGATQGVPPRWHNQPHRLQRGTKTASGQDTCVTRMPGNGQCVRSTEQRDGSHAPFQADTHHRPDGPPPSRGKGFGPSAPLAPPSAAPAGEPGSGCSGTVSSL